MTELVIIQYADKEYIGQINEIRAELSKTYYFGSDKFDFVLNRYRVVLIEKNTNCEISNIYVNRLFDIKPYQPGEVEEIK